MESNNWKRLIVVPLIVAAVFAGGIALGKYMPRRASAENGGLAGSRSSSRLSGDKLHEVLSLVYSQYVDEPRMDSIQEEVIPMILSSLDPHSAYIPARDMDEVNESIEGQFDGIGVLFNMLGDTVRVINVINGGPSSEAGLLAGDRIITIDSVMVAGMKIPQDSIVKRLRGPRGTVVDLGIERQGLSELLPVRVTRGVIPVKSVDAGMMVDGQTGYIRLSVFSRNSHQEVVRLVEQMKADGMKNLILDLQGNNGGLLDQAIYIANEFLPREAMIVYTEGRASRRREQRANGKGRLQDIDPVILLDEGSASASEIVAGALQDNDRGTIVGRRSFGKGLVQEQIPFSDGSAVRLTVARYYTPVGRSIQKPYEGGLEAYRNDLQNRFEHSELFSADSIRFVDSLRYTTPGGKVVYGGGGIMPDLFVPIDTTKIYPDFVVQVLNRNILFQYTVAWSDNHRQELNGIATLAALSDYFERNPALYDDFVRYASAQGFAPKGSDREASREVLTRYLRAYIGRNTVLDDNAFYYYWLPIDPVYQRAMEYLDDKQ
jgi:carboxyl-terminal processing protease